LHNSNLDQALEAQPIDPEKKTNLRHWTTHEALTTAGCVFCKAVRYDVAIEAGLGEDKAQMINDEFATSSLTAREKLILAFTDQYLHTSSVPEPELMQRLQVEFSQEELLHLSLVVACFNGFSRCAVALGGMPDEIPRMEIAVPR